MKPEIEESKIIELIKSFEDGRSMQVDELRLANARTEEQMKNTIQRLSEFNITLEKGMAELKLALKEQEGKFASKVVEKIVYGTCGAFGLLLIGALGILIFPHKAAAFAVAIINFTN